MSEAEQKICDRFDLSTSQCIPSILLLSVSMEQGTKLTAITGKQDFLHKRKHSCDEDKNCVYLVTDGHLNGRIPEHRTSKDNRDPSRSGKA